jgi:hypothetical protein
MNLPLELNFKEGQRIVGRVINSSPAGVLLEVKGNRFSVAVEGPPPSTGWTAFIVKEVTPERVLLTPVIFPNEQSAVDWIPLELFLRDDRISAGLLREKLPITASNHAKLDTLLNAFTSKTGFTPGATTFAYLLARDWPLTPGTILTAWIATDQRLRNMLWNSLQPKLLPNMVIHPTDISETILARILTQLKPDQLQPEPSLVGSGIDNGPIYESTSKTMLPNDGVKIPFPQKTDSNLSAAFLKGPLETGPIANDKEELLSLLIQVVKSVNLKEPPVIAGLSDLPGVDTPLSEKEIILSWLTEMLKKSNIKVNSRLLSDVLTNLIKTGSQSSNEAKLLDLLIQVIKNNNTKNLSLAGTNKTQVPSGIILPPGDEAKLLSLQSKAGVNDATGKIGQRNSPDVSGDPGVNQTSTRAETGNHGLLAQQPIMMKDLNAKIVNAQSPETIGESIGTGVQSGDAETILRLLTQNAAVKNSNNLSGTTNLGNVIPLLIAGQDGMISESLLEWTVKGGEENSSAGVSGSQWIRIAVPTKNLGEVGVLMKTNPGSIMIQFQVQSEAIKEQFNANLYQLRQLIPGSNPVVRVSLQQNRGLQDIGGDLDLCI